MIPDVPFSADNLLEINCITSRPVVSCVSYQRFLSGSREVGALTPAWVFSYALVECRFFIVERGFAGPSYAPGAPSYIQRPECERDFADRESSSRPEATAPFCGCEAGDALLPRDRRGHGSSVETGWRFSKSRREH